MRVLVAGALGDLGSKTSALLLAAGHEVHALTRSRVAELRERGLHPAQGDLFDREAISAVVAAVQPEAVVQLPIALPERGPIRARELAPTNRLRTEGTRNLLDASVAAGVSRYVAESIVAIYGYGDRGEERLDEGSPTPAHTDFEMLRPAVEAIHAEEEMVLGAARKGLIEGMVARVGFYYGAGVGSTHYMARWLRRGLLPMPKQAGAVPWVELSDAASGVACVLEAGASGETYNIVGDESLGFVDFTRELARQLGTRGPWVVPAGLVKAFSGYLAVMNETRLHVSNRKAREELGWRPRFPTVREGLEGAAPLLR